MALDSYNNCFTAIYRYTLYKLHFVHTYLTVFSLPELCAPAVVRPIRVDACSSILTRVSLTFIGVLENQTKSELQQTHYKNNYMQHFFSYSSRSGHCCTCKIDFICIFLPFLQSRPIRPGLHWQTYEPGVLIHVPPYKQGLSKHSFTSIKNNLISNTGTRYI